jgi:hypothetical protein
MELMQKALQKTQGVDDYLATMGGISKEVDLQLPPKFSIPEADRFAGVGVGVLLIAPDGVHIPLSAKLNFVATNNVAEYEHA